MLFSLTGSTVALLRWPTSALGFSASSSLLLLVGLQNGINFETDFECDGAKYLLLLSQASVRRITACRARAEAAAASEHERNRRLAAAVLCAAARRAVAQAKAQAEQVRRRAAAAVLCAAVRRAAVQVCLQARSASCNYFFLAIIFRS